MGHKWAKWLCYPCRLGNPHCFRAGGKIRSRPLVGKVAMSPVPSWGSKPLQSGGQNQKWPTYGQSGYVTPAVSGIPTASERGGEGITSGPLVGKVASSPLLSRGSPLLHSGGGGNKKCPTCGQSGYVTPAVSGSPTASERGGGGSEMAHKWAKWLRHPCRLGDLDRFRAGGKIRSGPLVGKVAMSPLPSRGSPLLQNGGQNQKWPTSGQSGYATPAVLGIPTTSERGAKSEVAHLWAKWLRHPCRLGDPNCFRAGGKIRSGPLVGKVAMSPLSSRGSPPLQSGGQNHKWPTCGQSGYVTPAVSGIPTASERGGGNQKWPTSGQSGYVSPAVSGSPTASERGGGGSEMAHLWAKWLCHPCCLGDPHRFTAGGGGNQKWPATGQSGYVTLAFSGIPTALERGAKSEVAHLWAKWLRHPCRLGYPNCFRAGGGEIRSGPLVGKVATSPLPSRGSPPLQSGGGGGSEMAHKWAKWLRDPCRLGDPHRFRAGGGNQKWPSCGQSGYVTPAVSGIPTASQRGGGGDQKWPTTGQSGYVTPAFSGIPTALERGAKSGMAHLWAKWLCPPCRLGDPNRFRAGGKIRSGPLMGKVTTRPLPSRGSPPLQSGGGEITSGPLVGKVATSPLPSRGSPPLQSGGGGRESEVAHKWANCQVPPCCLGEPHRFRAGGKIRSGPLVGKVAMSPLPSRGSPLLRSGGQNQKWPTCGQSGYVPPAVSGIPTASKRGAKSEVAHLWAK